MNRVSEKKIRAFLAIEPPDHIRKVLEAAQNKLKAELTGQIRWVSSQGIHLTLKFFGNIGERDIETVSSVLSRITVQQEPIPLSVKSMGVFPQVKRPRVIWLGTGGETEKLAKLASDIEEALEQTGFPREERPFKPHWTLARINGLPDASMLERMLEKYREKIWGEFTAESLVLFQSNLTPSGAIYTPLKTYPFIITGKNKKDDQGG